MHVATQSSGAAATLHQPDLPTLLAEMGAVGQRLLAIDAAEAAAGNLSVFTRTLAGVAADFPACGTLELPVPTPQLANGWVVVTGAGRRLRDIARSPATTVCVLHILPGGTSATLHAATSMRPTSELNSHLAIHEDHVARRGIDYHAVAHAQPLHLTYLSHGATYGDTRGFNREFLRWQPELIIEFPEGIGLLPFEVPGTLAQATVTASALRDHRAVLWQRHGIVTRADHGIAKAGDLIEYAETAARYICLNQANRSPTSGLSDVELRQICAELGIRQSFF